MQNFKCRFRTDFGKKSITTHRTAFVGESNLALNVINSESCNSAQKREEFVRELAQKLMESQGRDFYLNEYPSECVDHRVYIDIDMRLEDLQIELIVGLLEDLIVGDPDIQVLRNNVTGKVHIVVGVEVASYMNAPMKIILEFLRGYLWAAVDGEITRKQWMEAFDCGAKGLRSAFSVKMKGSPPEVLSRDYYVPIKPMTSRLDAIVDCSIYKKPTGKWTAEALEGIDETMFNFQQRRIKCQPSQYDPEKKTIPICGMEVTPTHELLNVLIKALPVRMAKGRVWRRVVWNAKTAARLIPGEFNAEYLLGAWSEQVPEEYNYAANVEKYKSLPVDPEEAGAAFTWLRNVALKSNKPLVLKFINPVSPIFDLTNDVYFNQYLDYCREYPSKVAATETVNHFIRQTVAYIIKGGRPFYMTKNLVNGQVLYDHGNPHLLDDLVTWREETEKDEKTRQARFGTFVFELHREIAFDRVDFQPYAPGESRDYNGIFNLFTEWKAKPLNEVDTEMIQPIISHMQEVLTDKNAEMFEYFANWLAHIVQKPRVKIGTALVFQSEQGAGKNIFTDFVVNHVIGPSFAITLNDIEQLTGRFNSVMEHKLLTVCDEMGNYGGSYKTNDKLKSLITQSEQNIERKGKDIMTIRDYNNYIMQSNNSWSVRIECSDRRYVACECSSERIGDHEYFEKLAKALTPEAGNAFLTWLMRRDLTRWNPKIIPNTKLRRELKSRALAEPIQFLIDMLPTPFYSGQKTSSYALYSRFNDWRLANQVPKNYSQREFTLVISRIVKPKVIRVDGTTIRGFTMDLETFKNALCAHLRITAEELEEFIE